MAKTSFNLEYMYISISLSTLQSTKRMKNVKGKKDKMQQKENKLGKSKWLRHPRKELAALALKPGRAKALRRHLRMF
uniref:Uncharacterized protein n=1 Tax=Aegilops tauschii subsp. strangulata TaxID=200361 RepID=A0A453E771_AEGTS